MEKRIIGKEVEINYEDTLEFFNSRGDKEPLKHRYNYVLFQDEHPELAVERDRYEKEKIDKIINFQKNEWVLDIGCGVGRWGEEILRLGLNYVGLDYSEQLLKVAKDNLKEYEDRCQLLHGCAQQFLSSLQEAGIDRKFDKVFINGVLTYLNHEDLLKCLEGVGEIFNKEHCILYIKETVGTTERLTLNQFYSDELKHKYTAIYRTAEEYEQFFIDKFVNKLGFVMKYSEDLFADDLKNRKETKDYYWVMER